MSLSQSAYIVVHVAVLTFNVMTSMIFILSLKAYAIFY